MQLKTAISHVSVVAGLIRVRWALVRPVKGFGGTLFRILSGLGVVCTCAKMFFADWMMISATACAELLKNEQF